MSGFIDPVSDDVRFLIAACKQVLIDEPKSCRSTLLIATTIFERVREPADGIATVMLRMSLHGSENAGGGGKALENRLCSSRRKAKATQR